MPPRIYIKITKTKRSYAHSLFSSQICYRIGTRNEPRHNKATKVAFAPREVSELPGHPPSLIRLFTAHLMGSLGSKLPPSFGSKLPPSLGSKLPPSLGSKLPPSLGSRLPPSLGSKLPPSLGSKLPPGQQGRL